MDGESAFTGQSAVMNRFEYPWRQQQSRQSTRNSVLVLDSLMRDTPPPYVQTQNSLSHPYPLRFPRPPAPSTGSHSSDSCIFPRVPQ